MENNHDWLWQNIMDSIDAQELAERMEDESERQGHINTDGALTEFDN